MKCAMLIALFLTTATALAEDKPAKEPADLVKIRKAYEAKVKAVVEPITAKYLEKLDEMKKAFGAKGDLESAQAVQKEIESMTPEKAAGKTTAKRTPAITIVGKWTYFDHIKEFRKDGTAGDSNGEWNQKWVCTDKKARMYQLIFLGGGLEEMQMSADGTTMTCTNKRNGGTWTSRRVPPDGQK